MKKGFTLAEVLITLAIIGVVAALTIPVVISNYRKQMTVDRLKTAYATLSKILQTAEAEHGSIASWHSGLDIIDDVSNGDPRVSNTVDEFTYTYMIPYMNVVDSGRKLLKEFGYKNGILRPNKTVFRSSETSAMGIMLANGIFMYVVLASHESDSLNIIYATGIQFMLDIDGPNHGANTVGKDIFVFVKYFSSDLKTSNLMLFGAYDIGYSPKEKTFIFIPLTRNKIYENCSDPSKARYCGGLILIDGWQIKDDYPWL